MNRAKRAGKALSLAILLFILLGVSLDIGVDNLSPQFLIDYFINPKELRTPELIQILVDEARKLAGRASVTAVVSAFAPVFIWLVITSFTRVELPGEARRRRWIWALLGFVGVLAGGGVVWLSCNSEQYVAMLQENLSVYLFIATSGVSLLSFLLVTAIATPSLETPAVLGGFLFRGVRSRLAL